MFGLIGSWSYTVLVVYKSSTLAMLFCVWWSFLSLCVGLDKGFFLLDVLFMFKQWFVCLMLYLRKSWLIKIESNSPSILFLIFIVLHGLLWAIEFCGKNNDLLKPNFKKDKLEMDLGYSVRWPCCCMKLNRFLEAIAT